MGLQLPQPNLRQLKIQSLQNQQRTLRREVINLPNTQNLIERGIKTLSTKPKLNLRQKKIKRLREEQYYLKNKGMY